MKVLIVDDEEEICKRLQHELKKEGYEVEYTTSSVGLMEMLHNAKREDKPYELLLLDLKMPKVSGFELLKEIRKARLVLDVIIITGYGDEDKAIEAIRLGAVDYLRKPIYLEELHTAIFRIQQKRAREEKMLRHSILVVDDEKDLCTRIKRELEKEGYQTAVAYDGVDGLDYFKNNRVDVVITDLRMPRMNGLDMLEQCKEITYDFVSIVITGHGDHETAIEALKLGVLNYLKKPISLGELVVSVDKGIDQLLLRRGLSARRRELEIEAAIKEQYAKNLEKMVEERTREIKKLSDAVEASIDSIVITDLEGRITNVNEATLEMYGADDKTDLIGKSSFDLIAPENQEKAVAGMRETMEKGHIKNQEYHVVIKNGSKLPVEMNVSIMKNVDGEPIGFVGITRDISERKQVEEAMRKLSRAVQQTADSVIITNKDDLIEYVNPAFERLTDYTRVEVVGKKPNILKSGKHDKKFYKELYETIHSGRVFRAEFINKKKNGEIYHVASTITPIIDMQGNITHFIATERDITEDKKAEELRLEKEHLVHASKAKSEFLATMSHELRTPLNSIIGFSGLLKQKMTGELNEKQEKYVENILTSGKHLLNLINDILDLSKVESGKIELVIEKVSVPETIDETLTLIKEKAAKHNVIIKKEIDSQLAIEADKLRFMQILFNLLDNAVKFSKKEGGIVTITAKKEGDMANISVSDTGIGIKEEDIGKLFNKFQQIDSSISRRYGGTGLGLAITKQLVEIHGGKIMAESKYGEGSTFIFSLPLIAGGDCKEFSMELPRYLADKRRRNNKCL